MARHRGGSAGEGGSRSREAHLGVFFVAPVDLGDAFLGGLGGGRAGEGLLHAAGSVPQATLDAEGLVQLVHLRATRTNMKTRWFGHAQKKIK